MIQTTGLTKRFGSLIAVDNLTLHIGPGEVFGFIGPNGAGKSTTMKILAGLLAPDGGTATVCGFDTRHHGDSIRRVLGYMPDFLGVYDDLTVDEYLQFFAAAFKIARARRRAVIDSVLELTDLTDKRRAMVDSLSRGMQQRLGVARVLIHEPKALLLDEPASGLDPRARIEMRELLKELRNMKKTILVSSHILPELADICNKIGIIERGKLLFNGDVETAIAQVRQKHVFLVSVGPERNEEAAKVLAGYPEVEGVDLLEQGKIVKVALRDGSEDGCFLPERLIQAGYKLRMFKEEEIDLEDVFMGITKGITN
jgi:ABC-2 type transport system ATP-binding protein